ncbi:carbon-nitrogen hydrolase family protein [Halobaculum sp. MBLA0143]|uniref:carbon-nitrogen hydrolase family protein n=1 Tax=Halobaculum sp. MBLA0143 TaxID=3079933 RepID=UPI0035264296
MGVPTVAACQMAVADLDPAQNRRVIADRIAGLPDRVDLAVFPEYALTGFVADDRVYDAAVARDGPAVTAIGERAREAGVAVTVGLVEDGPEGYHNATVYVGADGETAVYRKRHLWAAESEWLTPGTESVVVDTPAGRAGLVTCYDLNFVDRSAELARPAVELLLVGGAWPAAHSENWRLLLRARALDGVRWVVGAGRTGRRRLADADPAQYAGRSLVARPDGGVHRELDRGERDLVTELDPALLADQRSLVGVFDEE